MFFVDNFNSHAHVERDDLVKNLKERYPISTHTLTWSWLLGDKVVNCSCLISTHTLTWSVTISSCINTIEDIFQLTRSRGAWLRRSGNGGFLLYFNSHAHVERDGNTLCCFACLSLFQLTRSRGAWRIIINTDTNSTDFNSHAHVERDL